MRFSSTSAAPRRRARGESMSFSTTRTLTQASPSRPRSAPMCRTTREASGRCHVSAPPGSILNALEPAPVASRQVIGHFIPSAIFAALSGAMPGRLMAPGADPIWLSVWRGQKPPFTLTLFQVGGTGARPSKDGLSAVGFPSGVAGVPAEVVESLSPVVMKRRELRPRFWRSRHMARRLGPAN